MNVLLFLGELFVLAYVMRLIATRLKIPYVSAYVIGGVLIGGSPFIWIPDGQRFVEQWINPVSTRTQIAFITQIALGCIAFIIGAELEWSKIRSLGRSILFISFCEAFGAFLLVTVFVWLFWHDIRLAVLLGAVSSATAPAATVAIIQQYRARGPLTRTILAVVGIDDAISFIIFAFAIAFAKGSFRGERIALATALFRPLVEVIAALVLGSITGLLGSRLLEKTPHHEDMTFIFGTIILLISGIAIALNVSQLLANMAGGAAIVNSHPLLKAKIRSVFSAYMPIFYALFFIIGGMYLDISVFPTIWALAIVYFLSRAAGKFGGAFLGATAGNALPQVRNWVGLGLLPQVGAALALALMIDSVFGGGVYGETSVVISKQVINVLLFTTLLTEFVGPYLTKLSLFRVGEAERE